MLEIPFAFVAAGWKRCLAQSSSRCLALWLTRRKSHLFLRYRLSQWLFKTTPKVTTAVSDRARRSFCPSQPVQCFPRGFFKSIPVPGALVCREFLLGVHMNLLSSLTPPLTPCFAPNTPHGKHGSPQNPIPMGWERLVLGGDWLKEGFNHPGDQGMSLDLPSHPTCDSWALQGRQWFSQELFQGLHQSHIK